MRATADLSSEPRLFAPEWRSLTIGSVALCSMTAFEAIGVAAGMPAVAADLDGLPLYALAFSGTLAGSVVAMVWSGQDCDRHGPLRSMAGGIALFALGLLLAGLAGSMPMLVVGRVTQGLGVGALGVALFVATARVVPAALHPRLFALFSSAWVLPAVIGPSIAGWIVDQLGWRWLFLGVAGLLLPTAILILPPLRRRQGANLTTRSHPHLLVWALLASASSVSLALGAQAGTWAPYLVLASLGGAGLAAARLLPTGTLAMARGLPTVISLRGLNSAAFFLCEAFIPLWLNEQRGWSITAAGMALTGGALGWSLGSHLQSRIIGEVARLTWLRRGCQLLVAGIVICGLSVLGLLADWMMLFGWSITGLGIGLSSPMLGVLTLKLAPTDAQGKYSSALQLSAALGTGAALASGGLVFSVLHADAPVAAFASVFGLSALLALVGWFGSGRIVKNE